MALSRVKTWIALEVLTASDLNAEFNSILNNALSLISPLTGNLLFGGFRADNLADGSVSTPAMNFSADTNTGLYRVGTDEVAFTAGGSQALTAVLATSTAYAKVSGGISSGAAWQPGLAILNDVDTGLMSISADTLDLVAGGRRILQASAYATATNYLRVTGAQSGNPVVIDAAGANTAGISCATDFIPVALATGQTMRANAIYQDNIPKAWAFFDGTGTPKLISQFNIASITDIAAGRWRLNFNRAFLSTAYAAIGSGNNTSSDVGTFVVEDGTGGKSIGTFPVLATTGGGTATDIATAYIQFLGPQ